MKDYTPREVIQYVREDDVKFIRLAFCDVLGRQKNIAIMPEELPRAFEYGIAIDGSAVAGFGTAVHSDLFLRPDPKTLTGLPWRPESGKVVRMFCSIFRPDGTPFENDCRRILAQAVEAAEKRRLHFSFGPEMEFYLFKTDANGEATLEPYDRAGYMDVAPLDKGENVRREICLMLEKMGIRPESSHHEEGPGQNEIDFRYADALTAADNALSFRSVVMTAAAASGLSASFMPKPLEDAPGSGMHINFSVKNDNGADCMPQVIAGIMAKAAEMTVFLDPCEQSYRRLGSAKAPGYISWSSENRSQLIRIPAADGEYRRAELRSPDPMANPYLAFALLIYAGIYGVEHELQLPECADFNLYLASAAQLERFGRLPGSFAEAAALAVGSEFIREHLPAELIGYICSHGA